MPKVVQLIGNETAVFRDAEVVHAGHVSNATVICALAPAARVGGFTMVPDGANSGLKEKIRELVKKTAELAKAPESEIKLKVVGSLLAVQSVRKVLSELKFDGNIAGECHEAGAFEAYFYTDSGRLRVSPIQKTQKIRVLIVDDSKTIRQLLTRVLSSDAALEVVGAAECPSQAEKMIELLRPDVITLDIHMPEMDGVTFLKKFIPKFPIPTVMISSISMEEGTKVLHALENGAVDYIQKPSFEELDRIAPIIIEKVKTAVTIKVQGARAATQKRLSHDGRINSNVIVAIGASTGGTEALRRFFLKLPAQIPPILVVQHIPPVFSKAFANRLAELCPFEVMEAADGDEVIPNRVLIAPGGLQMALEPDRQAGYKVRLFDGEPVNRHKPSVDVLFRSVAAEIGKKSIGIIMTGMGRDGAAGLLEMRQAGASTIAQDEATSVVFGMPKEAIRIGAAEAVKPLDEIAETLIDWLQTKKAVNFQ